MAFLRTLFWIAVTVVVVVFSFHNWVPVTVTLFADLRADVKLPVLVLIAFLAGFLPVFVWHKAVRWRDLRRPAPGADPAPDGLPPATSAAAMPYRPLTSSAEPGISPARAD